MPVIPSYTPTSSVPNLGAATASGWGEPMGKVATQLAAQGKALADVSNKIADAVAGFGYPKTAGQGDVFGELGKSAGELWKYEADREIKRAEKELDDAKKQAEERKKKDLENARMDANKNAGIAADLLGQLIISKKGQSFNSQADESAFSEDSY